MGVLWYRGSIQNLQPRHTLSLLLPYLILAFPSLVWTARHFMVSDSLHILEIFSPFRIPHHYAIPQVYGTKILLPVLIYAGIGGLGITKGCFKESPVLLASFFSLLGLYGVLIVFTFLFFNPTVVSMQLFKMTNLLIVLAIVLFSGVLEEMFRAVFRSVTYMLKWCVLLLGLSMVYGIYAVLQRDTLNLQLLMGCFLLYRLPFRMTRIALVGMVFGFLLIRSIPNLPYVGTFPYTTRDLDPERYELYQWIKETTPPSALFVIPLDLSWSSFRTETLRGVVVDLKAHPYRADEILVWMDQIVAVSGLGSVEDLQSMWKVYLNYLKLGTERAQYLKRRFHAQYFVIEKENHFGHCDELKMVYDSKKFVVYELYPLFSKNRI